MDIYHTDILYNRQKEGIKNWKTSETNQGLILDFLKKMEINGISFVQLQKYVYGLKQFLEVCNKEFYEVEPKDIDDFLISMRKLKQTTKRLRYFSLKKFFDWLGKKDLFSNNGIKLNIKRMMPEELLTEQEIQQMIDSCNSVRDKAMLGVASELGLRVGELLSLRLKHVTFDDFGSQIMVNGKTGQRRVRLIKYSSLLWNWIQIHPYKDNPESPLWMTQFSRRIKGKKQKGKGWVGMEYNGFVRVLKQSAKRIGVNKRVYCHLLRHTQATKMSNIFTESQLKEFFGWAQGSKMSAVYVHLSGQNLDQTLLKHYGISTKEELESQKNKVVTCSNCGAFNSGLQIYCSKCGIKFSDLKEERSKDFIIELLTELGEKIPEVKNIAQEMAKKDKWKGFFD